MNDEPPAGPDWYPVGFDPAARTVSWLQLPGERFAEPFFEDTVRLRRRQSPQKVTSFAALATAGAGGSDPAAIFFHASRCGSTLVMQLLGRVPGCRALSEPAVIDDLLHDPAADDTCLRGLLRALGKSDGTSSRAFLKLDSWHLPHLARLRRLFPQVPCYFLYREPGSILRSHRRERGSQMVPGIIDSRRFAIDPATIDPADLDKYAERVLTAIFRQAVAAVEAGHLTPVDYSQLPGWLWETLGPALGLPATAWESAKDRAHFDSKQAHQAHLPSAAVPEMIAIPLHQEYARLEALRQAI